MATAALFPAGEMWEQSTCPLADKQIKIIYKKHLLSVMYTGTHWNVLRLKRESCHMLHQGWALLVRRAKWTNPKKTKIARFHFYEVSNLIKPMETEDIIVVAKGYEEEGLENRSSVG